MAWQGPCHATTQPAITPLCAARPAVAPYLAGAALSRVNTPPPDDARTLRRILRDGETHLARHCVDNPRVVMELLVARLLRLPRLQLLTRLDHRVPEPGLEALRRALRRVAAGEPVQYVLGEWDFRNLTLRTDSRALIPRPETELLVDWVLETDELWQPAHGHRPCIADIGTGTGCIILSLAAERPDADFIAVDLSADALALARENADRLGLAGRVIFLNAAGCSELAPASCDAIVSNPPYIPSAEVDRLAPHIRGHEPRAALDGGVDGLDIVRAIIEGAAWALRPGGFLFFETGHDQGAATQALMASFGFTNATLRADYNGHFRFVRGKL